MIRSFVEFNQPGFCQRCGRWSPDCLSALFLPQDSPITTCLVRYDRVCGECHRWSAPSVGLRKPYPTL
jgi:hypothetical protein